MAIALVTNVGATPGQDGGTSGAIDTSGSTLLVIAISTYTPAGTSQAPTDSKSNTWIGLTAYALGGATTIVIYYAVNPIVGSGHTFSYNLTSSFPCIFVQAFSGVKTSSPFDVENGFTVFIDHQIQPGSITPSENNELVVTAVSTFSGSSNHSIDSGFNITDHFDYNVGTSIAGAAAYKVQTSAAAVNPTWSWTTDASCAADIASFKASTATGQFFNFF